VVGGRVEATADEVSERREVVRLVTVGVELECPLGVFRRLGKVALVPQRNPEAEVGGGRLRADGQGHPVAPDRGGVAAGLQRLGQPERGPEVVRVHRLDPPQEADRVPSPGGALSGESHLQRHGFGLARRGADQFVGGGVVRPDGRGALGPERATPTRGPSPPAGRLRAPTAGGPRPRTPTGRRVPPRSHGGSASPGCGPGVRHPLDPHQVEGLPLVRRQIADRFEHPETGRGQAGGAACRGGHPVLAQLNGVRLSI